MHVCKCVCKYVTICSRANCKQYSLAVVVVILTKCFNARVFSATVEKFRFLANSNREIWSSAFTLSFYNIIFQCCLRICMYACVWAIGFNALIYAAARMKVHTVTLIGLNCRKKIKILNF